MKRGVLLETNAVAAGLANVLLLLGGCTRLLASAEDSARIELVENWKLASATEAPADGSAISVAGYRDTRWHPIRRMPATVLEILQEDGVYPNLYFGTNFLNVPQDLYKQDWWYRTTFKASVAESFTLEFPGINYRAEIWLNGEKIVDSKQVVGMYAAHELNVTPWIKRGSRNVLAVNWQSQKDADLGARANDKVMTLRQEKWADMTALNTLPPVALEIAATQTKIGKESRVTIRLRNPAEHIAFFERATISTKRDGNEIFPILYDDNYIAVFPNETAEIHGTIWKGVKPRWVKLEGYNTPAYSIRIR